MSAEAKQALETLSAHMDGLIGLCFTLGDAFCGEGADSATAGAFHGLGNAIEHEKCRLDAVIAGMAD